MTRLPLELLPPRLFCNAFKKLDSWEATSLLLVVLVLLVLSELELELAPSDVSKFLNADSSDDTLSLSELVLSVLSVLVLSVLLDELSLEIRLCRSDSMSPGPRPPPSGGGGGGVPSVSVEAVVELLPLWSRRLLISWCRKAPSACAASLVLLVLSVSLSLVESVLLAVVLVVLLLDDDTPMADSAVAMASIKSPPSLRRVDEVSDVLLVVVEPLRRLYELTRLVLLEVRALMDIVILRLDCFIFNGAAVLRVLLTR